MERSRTPCIYCPNCNGWGLWNDSKESWRCKKCKSEWCEVSIQYGIQPHPSLLGASFVPDEDMVTAPGEIWYRHLFVWPIKPRWEKI